MVRYGWRTSRGFTKSTCSGLVNPHSESGGGVTLPAFSPSSRMRAARSGTT